MAIVAGHTWGGELARDLTFTWHVPVFFILTGYLWREDRTLRDELGRRTRTLLVPYLAWALVVGMVFIATGGGKSIPSVVAHMLIGGRWMTAPFHAFWFVSALFVAAVVYRIGQPHSDARRVLIAISALVLGTVAFEPLSKIPEAAGTGMVGLLFLTTGDLLRRHRSKLPVAAGPVLLVAGVGLILVGTEAGNMKTGDLGTPLAGPATAVVLSVGLIVLAEAITPKLPLIVQRGAFRVATVGLVIVLAHGLVLSLLDLPTTWLFATALVLPLAVGMVVRRTPAAPILVGTPTLLPTVGGHATPSQSQMAEKVARARRV